MKYLLSILLMFCLSEHSYSQFDSSGYRFIFDESKINKNTSIKFEGNNLLLLRNSGIKERGIDVEIISINDFSNKSIRYSFDESISQKFISQIGIQSFAYRKNCLAILTNVGVLFADSSNRRLKSITREIDGFYFDNLELSDSLIYIIFKLT